MVKQRLCIFIDGTDDLEDNNTDVWRMHALTDARIDDQGVETLKYYTRGVGTAFGAKLRGSAYGFGTDDLIKAAYQWLVENYRQDDHLFIFGFSRGAQAARGLAGFVAKCGVLRPGSPVGVGELFDRSKTTTDVTIFELNDDVAANRFIAKGTIDRWMLDYSRRTSITMVGVWDTVGALLFEKGMIPTGLRVPILHAFHAIAIDEHRAVFAPNLITINTYSDRPPASALHRAIESVEQRWFVGAHANVGGGYNSDLLPHPSLCWLMNKASKLGMKFSEPLPEKENLFTAAINDSYAEFLKGTYRIATLDRPHYRPIGAPPKTTGTVTCSNVNETIDASVFERWRRLPGYRPKNLVEWAGRFNLDPVSLQNATWAARPHDNFVEPF